MSTSDRTLLLESAATSLAVLVILGLASPHDLGVPALGVHPAWLPITLFAARYGASGLCWSLIVIAVPLVAAGTLLADSHAALLDRIHNPSDVFALLTAVIAAWIGMAQGNRVRRVSHRLEVAQDAQERAEAAVDELSRSIEILRARCDRMDTSLTMWRSIAGRLESGTPVEAADAALELCEIRCGATAGVVQSLTAGDGPSIVTRRGAWSLEVPRPRDLSGDRTAERAAELGRLVCATELEDARESDCDVAVPVLDERDHRVIGLIALRGLDPADLVAAELHDLALIAAWLAAPIARLSARLLSVREQEEVHLCLLEPT